MSDYLHGFLMIFDYDGCGVEKRVQEVSSRLSDYSMEKEISVPMTFIKFRKKWGSVPVLLQSLEEFDWSGFWDVVFYGDDESGYPSFYNLKDYHRKVEASRVFLVQGFNWIDAESSPPLHSDEVWVFGKPLSNGENYDKGRHEDGRWFLGKTDVALIGVTDWSPHPEPPEWVKKETMAMMK